MPREGGASSSHVASRDPFTGSSAFADDDSGEAFDLRRIRRVEPIGSELRLTPTCPSRPRAFACRQSNTQVGDLEPMIASNLLRVSVVIILAGMVMGMAMGMAQDFRLMPAHAHLNLLGFVALF